MKFQKISMSLFLISFFFISARGQNSPMPPPPPVAAPTAENEKLIDEIILLSGYEDFYKTYAFKTIDKAAANKNWSKEEIFKRKKEVDFNHFKGTIYNAFAFYTKEELELLKKLYTSLNKRGKNNSMVMINTMIHHNMEGSVLRLITD